MTAPPSGVPCKYHERWGCTAEGTMDAGAGGSKFCLPHGVLFVWLVYGEGDEIERLKAHDEVARHPSEFLQVLLRLEPWDSRIRKVLGKSAGEAAP